MGSQFESKMMIKLIIFTLASAAMVLGAPGVPRGPMEVLDMFAALPDGRVREGRLMMDLKPEEDMISEAREKRSAQNTMPVVQQAMELMARYQKGTDLDS